MKDLDTPQWVALLNAIGRAKTDDIAEWKRIAEQLQAKLTPADRRKFARQLSLAASKAHEDRRGALAAAAHTRQAFQPARGGKAGEAAAGCAPSISPPCQQLAGEPQAARGLDSAARRKESELAQ